MGGGGGTESRLQYLGKFIKRFIDISYHLTIWKKSKIMHEMLCHQDIIFHLLYNISYCKCLVKKKKCMFPGNRI